MKLHLVDGTYELFRAHFGAPPATAPDGREVGATLGLLRSLFMLVSTPGVTHVACAFDHVVVNEDVNRAVHALLTTMERELEHS